MIKVKNNKLTSDIWAGMQIEPGVYYTIENVELHKWQNDSKVLTDIASGDLIVNDNTSDITDIASAINYLKGTDSTQKDSSGALLSRVKVTESGWNYQLHGLEFETSKLNSILSQKADGTDFGFAAIKFYDSNNSELTTQETIDTDCIKTVIDWEPDYSYELIGGMLKQTLIPTEDIRLWIVGVPDVPAAYGGSKEFVAAVNLKFIGIEEGIKADGRASKRLDPSPMHTNKLRLILKHPAGLKHKLMMVFEIFKP